MASQILQQKLFISYLIPYLFHQVSPPHHLHRDQYVPLCCSAKSSTSDKAAIKKRSLKLDPECTETTASQMSVRSAPWIVRSH